MTVAPVAASARASVSPPAYAKTAMRAVHDHIAAAVRRGQAAGVIAADRNADAEAWVMIAGALLRSVADRVGGLLDDGDLSAIQNERMRWLLADPVTG